MRFAAAVVSVLLTLTAVAPRPATPQVGQALPQATGMGGNYTALARGFGAIFWNPAGLGMPDNALISAAFLPVTGTAGMGPVTPGDFAAFDGRLIPHDARLEWLERIRAEDGETGTFSTDLTYAAMSVGRFAFSVSSSIRGRVNMGPDAAELLLFGNAGLTGDPRPYTLRGSYLDAAGTTTFAASVGAPARLRLGPLPDQYFAVGATVKFTVGNFLVMAQEEGSDLSSSPVSVDMRFPLVHTAFDDGLRTRDLLNNGSGVGLDVGAAWRGGGFAAGVTIRNLVNTFDWDRDALSYRSGVAAWSADTAYTHFEERPFSEAPPELVARLDEVFRFGPVLAMGAAARVLPHLTLAGELRHALEDNLAVDSRSHLGLGAELTALPFLPLRGPPGGRAGAGGGGVGGPDVRAALTADPVPPAPVRA